MLCIERQSSEMRDMDHLVLSGAKTGVSFAYGTVIIADITSESVLHQHPHGIIGIYMVQKRQMLNLYKAFKHVQCWHF